MNSSSADLAPDGPSARPGRVRFLHIMMAVATIGIGDLLLPPIATVRIPSFILTALIVFLFARETWVGVWQGERFGWRLKPRWPDLAVLGIVALFGLEKIMLGLRLLKDGAGAGDENAFSLYATVFMVGAIMKSFFRSDVVAGFMASLRLRPPQTMLISYLTAALIGALLLCLPQAVVSIDDVNVLDALFTSTSALCVTGLVLNNVGETYTFFGQAVIMLLMQAGGFGIMFFATFFVLLFTESMGFRKEDEMRSLMGTDARVPIGTLVRRVFALSILLEIAGAIFLFFRFLPEHNLARAAWLGIFHSVSGFCNAGFTLFPDSLGAYANSPTITMSIMALALVGSLGVPVLDDLMRWTKSVIRRTRPADLSLHTKVVLATTGILAVLGAVLIFLLEFNGVLSRFDFTDKVVCALFHSVAGRTSGFTMVDLSECQSATSIVMMTLMFIGGAPASTAGGLKVTVLAILVLAFRSALLNREDITAFSRRIPGVMISKSLGLLAASLILFGILLELLLLAEPAGFRAMLFEMVSAFNTVGWSLGVTGELGSAGKGIVIAAMLIGRIGPLTLAIALARGAKPSHYTYPTGSVLIG